MKLLGFLLRRLLWGVDLGFDAVSAVLRVLLRGRFEPDARSYRQGRYLPLVAEDVYLQEIAINAAEAEQARRIVRLDPERYLPLAPAAIVFDLIGPIDANTGMRTRPERTFLLGVVRRDALAGARRAANRGRRAQIEGFVHSPAARPAEALLFCDEVGDRRRRLRRAALAVALFALVTAMGEAHSAWRAALDRAATQADSERVAAERRIRLAERALTASGEALDALAADTNPSLAAALAPLAALGNRQAAHTEVHRVVLDGDSARIEGLSHEPEAAELEFRRAFEGAAIGFTAEPGEAGARYAAQISWPTGTGR